MEAFQRRMVRQTTTMDYASFQFSKVLKIFVLFVLPFSPALMCIVSSRNMWNYLLIMFQESPTLRFLFLNILIAYIIATSHKKKCSFQIDAAQDAEIKDQWIPPLTYPHRNKCTVAESEMTIGGHTLIVPGRVNNSTKQEEDAYLVRNKSYRGNVNPQRIGGEMCHDIAGIQLSEGGTTKINLTESNSAASIYLATVSENRGIESMHISPTVATVRREADNNQLVIGKLSANRVKHVAGNYSTKRRVQPSLMVERPQQTSLKDRRSCLNGDDIGSAEVGKENGRHGDEKHRAAINKAKHGESNTKSSPQQRPDHKVRRVDKQHANTTDKNGFQACPSMEEVWVQIMSNHHDRGCEMNAKQETQRAEQKEARPPRINEAGKTGDYQVSAELPLEGTIGTPLHEASGVVEGNLSRTPSELMQVQDLNRRAEEFIHRVNRQLRLQRMESLTQRRQRCPHVNETRNHGFLKPPSWECTVS
ncbi:hypothetical protein KP509_22G008800 [Ceratopteris richardii]|uniref:DUF4408 domain-containing protein n=1 Tax=Ceratopteris richardii TaxID=49495 RepID=A0A8T2S2J6_CERRI|nr:hypothetical protein KP509_22G008800 [Ceratopteris richardii]